MGRWEKFQKQQKRKLGEGRGENKVPKNKSEIRAEKGQRKKKSTWDGTGIEKRILSVHHPSMLVHWWVAGSLWPLQMLG